MGMLLRLRSTVANVGAAAYAAGDEISKHATAGSVVRPTFDLSGFTQGRILGAGVGIVQRGGHAGYSRSDG